MRMGGGSIEAMTRVPRRGVGRRRRTTTVTSIELLTLEGAQAGLSWSTILNKREGYRQAFAGFDPEAVARFGPKDVERLLQDAGIVRNRLKIESTIANAPRVLEAQEEHGSFAAYLWGFVDGEPLVGRWKSMAELPAETPLSKAMSKDLKKRGFRFVGPTVCYAFMQSVGLVERPHGRLLPLRRARRERADPVCPERRRQHRLPGHRRRSVRPRARATASSRISRSTGSILRSLTSTSGSDPSPGSSGSTSAGPGFPTGASGFPTSRRAWTTSAR